MPEVKVILAIDLDKWAAETYRLNFPGVRVECGPIKHFVSSLPDADIVLGGPPCQPFSLAGKGEGENDSRDCIPDFLAAVRRVRPRMFLMENVAGLLNRRHLNYIGRKFAEMESLGYAVEMRELDAVNFGVPQFRNRCWFWGIRSDLHDGGMRHRWPKPTHVWPPPHSCMFNSELSPGVTIGEALEIGSPFVIRKCMGRGMVNRGGDRRDHPSSEPSPTVGDWRTRVRIIGGGSNPKAPGERRTNRDITDEPSTTISVSAGNALPEPLVLTGPQTADRPSYTITAGSHDGGPEPISNRIAKGFSRRLLPLECARLQSVNDGFLWPEKITKTAMYRIIGNGQASLMVHRLRECMERVDPESRTVIDLFCGGGVGASGWHGKYWTV